jgi:bZIP factor
LSDGTDIRSFKVSLEDPAWKVLPAALKKYKINNDDWQNYAMFICYGNTGTASSIDSNILPVALPMLSINRAMPKLR